MTKDELYFKVRDDPSPATKAFLRDHPAEDEPDDWNRECRIAVAMMIEEGKLFYDERTKCMIKPYPTKQ